MAAAAVESAKFARIREKIATIATSGIVCSLVDLTFDASIFRADIRSRIWRGRMVNSIRLFTTRLL